MAQRDNQRTTEDEKKNAEQQQQHDPQSTPTPTKAAAVFSLSSDVVSQPIRTLAVVELQHVLTYLKSLELLCVSRVSRVWYSAVDSPLVWQHLDPREDDPDLAQLTSKDFARQDFLTSAQCSAYGYEDTLVSSPWRSPLYRRRQPIYVTFDDGLSIADLPLVREHLSHLVNIRSVHFHTSVRIATLFAITSTITFAHLRAVKFNGRDPSADAVRHLLLGSPKLESMILGQWKGDFDRTFACAPTSLTSLEITTAFEDGYLSTLAKLPHLQQLCLPTQLRPKSLFLPAASPVSFPSLARLTLTWNDWWIKVNDSPIDEIPISLVQATPHVRVLQLEGYRGLDYYCERIITAIAAWPSTVLPQLQHIAFPQQQRRPDLRRVHKSLLAHLPQLLQNRPVHPFCVHLLVDAAELTSPESAVFQLPSVRLMVSPMRSMDELTVDEGLLRRMDLAASSITLSKSDMLQLIQAEQLRLETAAPAASEEEEEAREEKEA